MKLILEKRILEYCKELGIEFVNGPRYSGWREYGLPDLRSFTPHLRIVNLYLDENFSSKRFAKDAASKTQISFSTSDYWLLHDALHIMFYDFASAHLGTDSWTDSDRFLENHLASELFAVLVLDYHHLVHTEMAGLAVDLSSKQWPTFQKQLKLPEIKSFEFFEHLFKSYFGADDNLLSFGHLKKFTSGSQSKSKDSLALANWLGHELRYGEKQRNYAYLWLQDLNNVPKKDKSVLIEESEVIHPIWDLVQTLTAGSDSEWNELVSFIKKAISNEKNYFAKFKKYSEFKKADTALSLNTKTKNAKADLAKNNSSIADIDIQNLDFRFTDILAIDPKNLKKFLKPKLKPTSSNTFLFWQILSTYSPEDFGSVDLKQISEFSKEVQKPKAKVTNWDKIQKLALECLENKNWQPDLNRIASFFLP